MNDIGDNKLYNGTRSFAFKTTSTYYSMYSILQFKNILVLSFLCDNIYDIYLLHKAFNQKYLPRAINTIDINILNNMQFYSDITLDQVKKLFESISITSPSHYKYLKSFAFKYDLDHLRRNFFEIYNSFSIAKYIIPHHTNFLTNIEILHIPLHYSDVRKFFDFLKKGGIKKLKVLESSDPFFYKHFNVLHTHLYKQHFIELFKLRNISIPFPDQSIELYDNQICRTFFRELLDINRPSIGQDIFKKIDVCIQNEEFLSLFISLSEKNFFLNCIHLDLYLWFLTGEDDIDHMQIQSFTHVFINKYFPKLESLSFDFVDYINTLHSKHLWIEFFKKFTGAIHLKIKTLRITNYSYHVLLCLLESGVPSTIFQFVKHLEIGTYM